MLEVIIMIMTPDYCQQTVLMIYLYFEGFCEFGLRATIAPFFSYIVSRISYIDRLHAETFPCLLNSFLHGCLAWSPLEIIVV